VTRYHAYLLLRHRHTLEARFAHAMVKRLTDKIIAELAEGWKK